MKEYTRKLFVFLTSLSTLNAFSGMREILYTTDSGMKVERSRMGICLTDQDEKFTLLQSSLLAYMKAKKESYDNKVFEAIEALKELKVDEKGKILLTLPRSILFNLSEITYTDEDIKLLEKGKLIKVKDVPAVKYTNKKYVDDWNKRHPEDPKKIKSKMINPIIICEIERASDQEKVELIIDLKADISILFNNKYRKYNLSDVMRSPLNKFNRENSHEFDKIDYTLE